jgi:thiol-disulfide isomerase/thioredoxin
MLAPAAQLAFVACAAILVYSFVAVAREAETRRKCSAICILHPDYAGADRRMPDFTLKDLNGRDVSGSSFLGKVLVVNFWNTTCGPCRQEMPELAELAKILRPYKDVALITISTNDGPDDTSYQGVRLQDWLKTTLHEEPPFPELFDPDGKIANSKFGTHLVPETWIVDKRGVIRARFDGAREWGSSAVVELIDDLRGGGFCAVNVREGKVSSGGDAAKTCEVIGGGSDQEE